MRYTEFKTILHESSQLDIASQTAVHDINVISTLSQEIPPEQQNITAKISQTFKALSDKIAKALSKVGIDSTPAPAQPVQQPVQQPAQQVAPTAARPVAQPQQTTQPAQPIQTEAVAVDTAGGIQQQAEMLKNQLELLENSEGLDPVIKKKLVSEVQAMLKNCKALLKQVKELKTRAETAEQEKIEANNFLKEVNNFLVTLGNKVQGFTMPSPEEFKALKAAEKKKVVNAQEFTTTLRRALFGLVTDISIDPSKGVTNAEIKDFLTACVRGEVINMLSVVEQDRGNIREHVNPKYQKMFDLFVDENIFSYSPGKTSGAIGPGEMALSMMGNPAEKADVGDLKIGDTMFEVKAGATSGGRLNSKQISKATAGWKTWSTGIEHIVKTRAPDDATFNLTDNKGNVVKVKKGNYSADTWNVGKADDTGKKKIKKAAQYNFSPSGLAKLNDEILVPYSNQELTFSLFYNTFKSLILNLADIEKNGVSAQALIGAAIYDDGSINVTKMIKSYTRLAYESYHLADGITSILFLNTSTLDYSIVQDGNDLVNKLGLTVKITSGFNFNDDQQTPTPAYLALANK